MYSDGPQPEATMPDFIFLPIDWLADTSPVGLGILVFLLLLLAVESCFRLGLHSIRHGPASDGLKTATGIVTAGMLALFAFLLGVMFSLAADRYEKRRQTVLDEANAIGTAWLRAGLAGEQAAPIRTLLREYLPLRIQATKGLPSMQEARRVLARTHEIQAETWALVVLAAERAPNPISATIVVSFNEMFDIATTNRRNFRHGVPPYVLRLVVAVAALSVAAMGYQFGIHGHRQVTVTVLLLLTWTLALGLVVDIDAPRQGSVRVDPAPLVWTLDGWGPP
jgi:hypothetical protein